MNKKELTKAVAAKCDTTVEQAKTAVNATLEAISNELQQGGNIALLGFGSFKVCERKARNGFNPHTRKVIKIKATKTVKFKLSSRINLNKKK